MARIGRQLLIDSKATVAESEKGGRNSGVQGRDLLSLLVRANTSPELLDSQRLSDEDVLARMHCITITSHWLVHWLPGNHRGSYFPGGGSRDYKVWFIIFFCTPSSQRHAVQRQHGHCSHWRRPQVCKRNFEKNYWASPLRLLPWTNCRPFLILTLLSVKLSACTPLCHHRSALQRKTTLFRLTRPFLTRTRKHNIVSSVSRYVQQLKQILIWDW